MAIFEFTTKTNSSVLQIDGGNQIPIKGYYLPVVLMPDNIKIGFRPLNTIEGLTQLSTININVDTIRIDSVIFTGSTAKDLYDSLESLFFLDDVSFALSRYVSEQTPNEEVDVYGETISVMKEDFDKIFNVLSSSSYNVVLPSLGDVHINNVFRFKNLINSDLKGTFVPVSGEHIEGLDSFNFFGRGTLSIRKNITDENKWSIIEISNLLDHTEQGKTKEVYVQNHNGTYEVVHNRGYRPIVQVYLEDGLGGYSEVEVDIDHNSSLDSFIVNLEGTNTGYIRYV